MFEAELKERLERIFDFKKTRFDDPGESLEQECLFINVESARCDIKDGQEGALVRGQGYVYANFDKLPYGYFNKKLRNASIGDLQKFFFHEIDHNSGVTNNIVRRSFRFVFYYKAQYDPRIGRITSVEFQEEA